MVDFLSAEVHYLRARLANLMQVFMNTQERQIEALAERLGTLVAIDGDPAYEPYAQLSAHDQQLVDRWQIDIGGEQSKNALAQRLTELQTTDPTSIAALQARLEADPWITDIYESHLAAKQEPMSAVDIDNWDEQPTLSEQLQALRDRLTLRQEHQQEREQGMGY